MPHAFLKSVVLITGTNSSSFGTGFAIDSRQGATWILTCAHVVEDVGGTGNVLVDDKPAEVLACGKPKEIDLAVLRVQGLNCPPLKLGFIVKEGMPCGIAGFADLTGELKRAKPLEGKLHTPAVLKAPGGPRINAWNLRIKGKTPLEKGYSGSPVVCATTGTVVAVTSVSEYQGKRGVAVLLAHLKDVWPELPSGLVRFQLQTGDWLAREQREFLENLFQKPPESVSDEKLRAWCYQAMPDKPYDIPADANTLDLLEWLVERGRLASRKQVPFLSVLRKLLPLVTDADASNSLKQCIKQTAGYFDIPDIHIISEPALTQTTDKALALMLEIWPSAPPGNRCNVQGRLFYASGDIKNLFVREKETALNLNDDEDRTDLVEELHEQLFKRKVKEEVIVEFILPRELLSQAVEQWTDSCGDPLGARFPVVVRPRQCLREQVRQIGWQNCWNTLSAHWEKTLPDVLWWFEEFEESRRRQVLGKLQEGICIVLGFVPDLLALPRQNAVLYLLRVGTPVALWPRQQDGLVDFVQQLQTFLTDKPLKNLPKIIHAMRRELWGKGKQATPCYHLTLLWDDPNRHIPDKPENDEEFLQAPV